MARLGDAAMTSTINFKGLARRLTDAENAVFEAHKVKIMTYIANRWTGWLYARRSESAARLVSYDMWKAETETTASRARLVIFNRAKTKKGKYYANFVHRSGKTMEESDVVWAEVKEKLLPAMRADIRAAVAKTITTPGKPQKLAGRRTSIGTRQSRER